MVVLAHSPVQTGVADRCLYQAQDSSQTLAEGLAEYYARNRDRILPPSTLAPESAALFRSHDICHVIFGLDTTLSDEAMADTRTLISCDVGWMRYAKYLASDKEAKALFKEIGYSTALWGTVRTIPRILRAVVEAWRISKRWPWVPPDEYLHRSLSELRREFGIRLI